MINNHLIEKYKDLSVQIKASMWFVLCAFIQKGISVISTPIFTRLLSAEEYGVYNVFNSWLGIVTVIVTLGLYYGVYMQGLVKFSADRARFSSSLQGLTLFLVLVWFLIYYIFRSYWNSLFQLTTIQMTAMFLIIWSNAVYSFWFNEQRSLYRYRSAALVTLLAAFVKPIVEIIMILQSDDKVTARILGIAAVELIFYTGLFFSHMKNGRVFFHKKYWAYVLKFNIPLIPHYLSGTVLNSSDRIMISRMTNDRNAGMYGVAYSVSMLTSVLSGALNQTLEPWLYKKIHEGKTDELKRVTLPAAVIIGMANLLLIAFAPELIKLFAPSEYYDAIWIVPPVCMSVLFMFWYTTFATFEFYYEKTHWITLATAVSAIANILLNYVCIRHFGYYAAGYTTLFCYMLYAALHYAFMRRICREKMDDRQPYPTRSLLLIALLNLLAGTILLLSYRFFSLRIVVIICGALATIWYRKRIVINIQQILQLREKRADEIEITGGHHS